MRREMAIYTIGMITRFGNVMTGLFPRNSCLWMNIVTGIAVVVG
jgi:hypothetical protein